MTMTTYRSFRLTLSDLDGEVFTYDALAPSPVAILAYLARKMDGAGDFYGHTQETASSVRVDEVVPETRMDHPIVITL
jgi:hypothetical protein